MSGWSNVAVRSRGTRVSQGVSRAARAGDRAASACGRTPRLAGRPGALSLALLLGLGASVAPGCGDGSTTGGSGGDGGSGGAGTSTGQGGTGGATGTSTASSGGSGGAGGGAPAGPITLLTLNLHCFQLGGTTFPSNAERFAAIVAFAAASDVDVMTVQEACARPGEDAIQILRAGLSEATSAEWTAVWAFAHVAWEGTPDEADEGVGLLVRGQVWSEVAITHAAQGALQRVTVSGRLPAELGGARVTSVHLDVFDAAIRMLQAREAAADALADSEPLLDAVVAGDFNDVEGSPAWTTFQEQGYLAADQGLDPAGIDHVMIHRAAPLRPVMVEKVLTGASAVSDHPGVLVRLEPAAGDPVTVTRIFTGVDPGLGHFLSVRGDAAPLSWDAGIPMRRQPPDAQALVLTEVQGAFKFKILRDDTDWQTGADVSGTAGTDQTVTPVF